jgi:hypothetical protein
MTALAVVGLCYQVKGRWIPDLMRSSFQKFPAQFWWTFAAHHGWRRLLREKSCETAPVSIFVSRLVVVDRRE